MFFTRKPTGLKTKDEPNSEIVAASASKTNDHTTDLFAKVAGKNLFLYLPALGEKVIGIGYHQAYNRRALSLVPVGKYFLSLKAENKLATGMYYSGLKDVIMDSRGRGTSLTSSVDVAIKDNQDVLSPVTGKVIKIVPYKLYGRLDDIRIEIEPDGYRDLKVAIVHLTNLEVGVGSRVIAGSTRIAKIRPLGIHSQIDDYFGKDINHVHIQINPKLPSEKR